MSLEFLERMKARQRAKERRGERERDPRHVGEFAIHLRDGSGFLVDETGEPVTFAMDLRTNEFDNPKERERVEYMVAKIASGQFGPCLLPNRQDYYARRHTLKPL